MMGSADQEMSKAEHNGVIQSSIGLLQERFRQLQRMKEMRMRHHNQLLPTCFSHHYKHPPTITHHFTNTLTATTLDHIIFNNTKIKDDNINNSIVEECMMPNSSSSSSGDVEVEQEEEELQIFISPNDMSNNNRNVCSYSSPSSSLSSSSSSSQTSYQSDNKIISFKDVTLSLWPPTNTTTTNTAAAATTAANHHCGRQASIHKEWPSTTTTTTITCFNLEDPPHYFSDVDTTLHL